MSNTLFIGGGNMGSAIIAGLIADGCSPNTIYVLEHHAQQCQQLKDKFGVHATSALDKIPHEINTIVFAVKPQHFKSAALDIMPFLKDNQCIISIAAGIPIALIEKMLGMRSIVRAMPNTPALVNCGATALFAHQAVSTEQKNEAERLLRAVGLTVWVDSEEQMDVVTGLSGSGPAYFFALIEHMQNAATKLGLPADIATQLAKQTALGAARLALESDLDVSTLREQVTSPGGTTAAALDTFNQHQFSAMVEEAIGAAVKRAKELAKGE